MKAEIINQPYSGEYKERIYDTESPWNSQSWTWIKFTDDFGVETVGQFRGFPKNVKVSKRLNEIIVLTSDYLYRLDFPEYNVIETEDQPVYQGMEVTPDGIFVFYDYDEVLKMGKSISEMEKIQSPFKMAHIQFRNWNGDKLEFECEEFMNWSRSEIMELDTSKWTINVKKNATQQNL